VALIGDLAWGLQSFGLLRWWVDAGFCSHSKNALEQSTGCTTFRVVVVLSER
jgi:hypothetical protein